jgi:hypothetical protein
MNGLEIYLEDLLATLQQLADAATRIANALERAEAENDERQT